MLLRIAPALVCLALAGCGSKNDEALIAATPADLGIVADGKAVGFQFQVDSAADEDLSVTLTADSAWIQLSESTIELPARSSRRVDGVFHAYAAGDWTLPIVATAGADVQTKTSVTAHVTPVAVDCVPDRIAFPPTLIWESSLPIALSLRSLSDAPLTVALETGASFAPSSKDVVLQPDIPQQISVTFTPREDSFVEDRLQVIAQTGDVLCSVKLTGEVATLPIAFVPGTVTLLASGAADATIELRNETDAPFQLGLPSISPSSTIAISLSQTVLDARGTAQLHLWRVQSVSDPPGEYSLVLPVASQGGSQGGAGPTKYSERLNVSLR